MLFRSILDFAPEKRIVKDRYIGGRIVESFNEILLEYTNLSPEIELMKSQILEGEQILPPRLLGQNSMEVLENCYSNFKICNSLLLNYLQNPTPILIINDIGIFLHLGGLRTVEKALNLSTTALINAYYGDFIADDYGSYISRREKIMLGLLARKMETIYFNKPLREKLLW